MADSDRPVILRSESYFYDRPENERQVKARDRNHAERPWPVGGLRELGSEVDGWYGARRLTAWREIMRKPQPTGAPDGQGASASVEGISAISLATHDMAR